MRIACEIFTSPDVPGIFYTISASAKVFVTSTVLVGISITGNTDFPKDFTTKAYAGYFMKYGSIHLGHSFHQNKITKITGSVRLNFGFMGFNRLNTVLYHNRNYLNENVLKQTDCGGTIFLSKILNDHTIGIGGFRTNNKEYKLHIHGKKKYCPNNSSYINFFGDLYDIFGKRQIKGGFECSHTFLEYLNFFLLD